MLAWLVACASDPDTGAPIGDSADSADSADSGGDPAPDPACAAAGCLRSARSLGSWTREDLRPYVDAAVTLENGYEVLVVEYLTESGPTTGTVTLPLDLVGDAPPSGFPVVVNAHGTVGLDDVCRLSGTVSGSGLAGLFGARGAIGVAPDYPGLGSPGYHRYLDARAEATSVLDAIRAAAQVARWRAVPDNGRSAVVGLSQGGHAALAAATWHSRYAPELDVRAFAASGPASGWHEHWAPYIDIAGGHLVMHALLAWSYAEATGTDDAGVWADTLAPTVDAHLTTRCYWSPDFGAEPLLSDGFPVRPADVFTAPFREAWASGDWGAWPALGDRFSDNRIEPWLAEGEQTAAIAVWQGTDDTTVLPWMTQDLVAGLRAGGVEVELTLVEGGTHTTTAFGFLATPELATDPSLAWVRARLEE